MPDEGRPPQDDWSPSQQRDRWEGGAPGRGSEPQSPPPPPRSEPSPARPREAKEPPKPAPPQPTLPGTPVDPRAPTPPPGAGRSRPLDPETAGAVGDLQGLLTELSEPKALEQLDGLGADAGRDATPPAPAPPTASGRFSTQPPKPTASQAPPPRLPVRFEKKKSKRGCGCAWLIALAVLASMFGATWWAIVAIRSAADDATDLTKSIQDSISTAVATAKPPTPSPMNSPVSGSVNLRPGTIVTAGEPGASVRIVIQSGFGNPVESANGRRRWSMRATVVADSGATPPHSWAATDAAGNRYPAQGTSACVSGRLAANEVRDCPLAFDLPADAAPVAVEYVLTGQPRLRFAVN